MRLMIIAFFHLFQLGVQPAHLIAAIDNPPQAIERGAADGHDVRNLGERIPGEHGQGLIRQVYRQAQPLERNAREHEHRSAAGFLQSINMIDILLGIGLHAFLRFGDQCLTLTENRGAGRACFGTGGRQSFFQTGETKNAFAHARRNGIPWDAILGSEIARDFKPKPAVYSMSAAALDLRPEEVMMCAAHSDDLRSAASNGLRTAHIARPGENGPGTGESAPRYPVDFAATSMENLATQLGV